MKEPRSRVGWVTVCFFVFAVRLLILPSPAHAAEEHPLLPILESELKLSLDKLVSPEGTKPYFLQYVVADSRYVNISATLGSLTADMEMHRRDLDVSVRCGDYKIDSTRQIRDSDTFGGRDFRFGGLNNLPLNDDPVATRHAIWLETDERFKAAVKRLAQVKANLKVKVEEEDPSDDFSREEPSTSIGPWLEQSCDRISLAQRARDHSKRFRAHPEIYSSSVSLIGNTGNQLIVNSEGSKLQWGQGWWRIGIMASTIADDGMELWQYRSFDAHSPDRLPSSDKVDKAVDQIIDELLALRKAPIVEPYTGPAILMNRASGVFFHEIFGHRIEGHRQKDVEEGQTFAKKLGKDVLPDFLAIVDDPSQKQFKGFDLNGYYPYDDECVPAQPAVLVEKGILKSFLMSRSPTRGVNKSNGHGRCQMGMSPVARQGNLFVKSAKTIPFAKLREMLIAEVKKQKKDYGLLFSDISGGFTMTQRWMPQAFKVMPILVYKVYPDGRPDELVRGVDIVGTPLTCFSKILATADDDDVFNGVCGAESGSVPVSAISPSILVEQIEIEKKRKAQDRPPILDPPIAEERKAVKSDGTINFDGKEDVQ
jgi:TldD protein